MEEEQLIFTKNNKKLEQLFEGLCAKEEDVINQTLEQIQSELISLPNFKLDEEENHYFLNTFSPKLLSSVFTFGRQTFTPIFMTYLQLVVFNLENYSLLKYFSKQVPRIINKKEHHCSTDQIPVIKYLTVISKLLRNSIQANSL